MYKGELLMMGLESINIISLSCKDLLKPLFIKYFLMKTIKLLAKQLFLKFSNAHFGKIWMWKQEVWKIA
jgi:hypothetical protein